MEIFKNIFHLLFYPKSSANTRRKLTWLEHFLQESNIIIKNIAIERYGKATDSPSHLKDSQKFQVEKKLQGICTASVFLRSLK
jgi:hypothetical protein